MFAAATFLALHAAVLAAQSAAITRAREREHMCAFCHRLAASEAKRVVPLWQPSAKLRDGFSLFPVSDPSEPERITSRDSRSVVCLSCHEVGDGPAQGQFRYGHPFGVPYGGAPQPETRLQHRSGADYAWRSSAAGREGFRPALRGAAGRGWRVPVFGSVAGLPLFERDDPAARDTPFIECETCHDPHNDARLFLRVAGDRLCLSCHNV